MYSHGYKLRHRNLSLFAYFSVDCDEYRKSCAKSTYIEQIVRRRSLRDQRLTACVQGSGRVRGPDQPARRSTGSSATTSGASDARPPVSHETLLAISSGETWTNESSMPSSSSQSLPTAPSSPAFSMSPNAQPMRALKPKEATPLALMSVLRCPSRSDI